LDLPVPGGPIISILKNPGSGACQYYFVRRATSRYPGSLI